MRIQLSVVLLGFLTLTGCDKSKDKPKAPEKAVLSVPAQNEACTTGVVISATQSQVVFKWEKAAHTENYELTIKNLESGNTTTQTLDGTEASVTLTRNTPYSWFVVSKSSKNSETAKSEVWKFYNAGPGVVSYSPFPAEIVTPSMGQIVTSTNGKINLDWTASDVDNDIVSFNVYFGNNSNPQLLASNISNSALNDVSVISNTTYYWKVVTKDSKGNTSETNLYEFTVK